MNEKILAILGMIGGGITTLFGGWTTSTTTLFIFMLIDYFTGIIDAMIFKNSPKTETGGLSSKVGWRGLAKKCMILLFLLVAYRLDLTMDIHYIKDSVCIAFILNELVSITENASLMGMTTPSVITNAIDLLKKKSNEKTETVD